MKNRRKNIVAIRREGIAKKGEKRVALIPEYAKRITEAGYPLLVQPAVNPETDELKRAFPDSDYEAIGATINEDLSDANIIFGLKEINVPKILPGKVYFFFSHTHKGQVKNREMLRKLVELKNTVIDYELIADEKKHRLINAFTYNAGYAGMIDSLWTLGKRWKMKGISNPFNMIPQSIEVEDLHKLKMIVSETGKLIEKKGTPAKCPPVITTFLGKGKTSIGAQSIYDLLPVEQIDISRIMEVFFSEKRNKVYKLVLSKGDIYKIQKYLTPDDFDWSNYFSLSKREREHHYMLYPKYYLSDMERYIQYTTILMNCVAWSQKYPRSITEEMLAITEDNIPLQVIGDITCDPNGSIEFSKETWIDDPVFIYNKDTGSSSNGFKGKGIAVMAVTNLPCEFSADASEQFSHDLSPFIIPIIEADYSGTLENSRLPDEIIRAVIMWKGEFTPQFEYMKRYLNGEKR